MQEKKTFMINVKNLTFPLFSVSYHSLILNCTLSLRFLLLLHLFFALSPCSCFNMHIKKEDAMFWSKYRM